MDSNIFSINLDNDNGPICNTNVILVALHPIEFPFIGESHGISIISGYLKSKFDDINVYLYDQQLDCLDDILKAIKLHKPAILGIAVKMKTFDQMQIFYERIDKEIPKEQRPYIVIGNSIPHFNGETILTKYFNDVFIGLGEGEIIMSDLYNYIHNRQSFESIRNIMYIKEGKIHSTKRSYLSGEEILLPDRSRTYEFYKKGGEVYIEASRGCAYCGCKICECRDFLGSKTSFNKWRPRSIYLILLDMKNLMELGVKNITFADEDFLGFDDYGIDRAIRLAKAIMSNNININFRINVRVKSIYNENDTDEMRLKRQLAIQTLKKSGLVKIFMGLESGSLTQLKRYGKGFKFNEFRNAYQILNELNIDYELGFILMDPLMSFNEFKENLMFIKQYNIISKVSSIYKKLRIQRGNKLYLSQVRIIEAKKKIKIVDDLNFYNQEYDVIKYVDDTITFIIKVMNQYDNISYKIYYLFRIITQYSDNSSKKYNIDQSVFFEIIGSIKNLEFAFLEGLVDLIEINGLNILKGKELLYLFETKKRLIFASIFKNKLYSKYCILYPTLNKELNAYVKLSESLTKTENETIECNHSANCVPY